MVKHKKGQVWNKALTPIMLQFEQETNKSAIYRDKITGQFEFWLWKNEEKEIKQKKWKATIPITSKMEKGSLMLKFEKETGKSAIHNGKITKQFNSWLTEEEHFDYQLSKAKKTKPKRQVIDKKLKRIDEIQREINWINKQIKSKEDNIDEKVKRDKEYWRNLLEKERNTTVRKRYHNQISKVWNKYQNEIYKLRTKRDKEKAKIIAVNLNFNKINKIVRDTLIKSKYHASHQVRGYGESSTGYEIKRPTLHDPYITIRWIVYWSVSTENRKKSIKKFKDKLKPVLRENNIKFTEDDNSIFIGK